MRMSFDMEVFLILALLTFVLILLFKTHGLHTIAITVGSIRYMFGER